ncbi:MAG: hypothetical protein GX540_04220 [Clostridiales bacterium]|nr:hypothetical protein [Clostridiales bacterium]
MAQKAITIYTPPAAAAHINAEDDAQIYRALFGGSGITAADNKLACTKVDDGNVVLASGVFCNQGYMLAVQGGTSQNVAVPSNAAGTFRQDYLVAEFNRGGGSTADTHVFKLIPGTPNATENAAQPPALTKNDLGAGGAKRQEALFLIKFSGATLSSITRIAPYIGNYYA